MSRRDQARATAAPIHVAFLIRSLERGGAQRQLVELARNLPKDRFRVSVITFYSDDEHGGTLATHLAEQPGIRLFSLQKRGRWDVFTFLGRLWYMLHKLRPDIVHGYMGVANELALIFGKVAGAKVIWGLRASNMMPDRRDWAGHALFKVGATLSRYADAIIVNSHAGKWHHTTHGYARQRMAVIPNGIDTEHFRRDAQARSSVRHEWGIRDDETAIGLVARLDPMKDHPTFLHAAAILAPTHPQIRFICVGNGALDYAEQLRDLANGLGLGTKLVWAGARDDMSAVYNAFDIATSSSAFGEGFSNAIAEAIACGLPCVATDVGDAAIIVRDAARIVPPGDPSALAAAWSRLLQQPPEERARSTAAAQERISHAYSAAILADRTAAILRQVLD